MPSLVVGDDSDCGVNSVQQEKSDLDFTEVGRDSGLVFMLISLVIIFIGGILVVADYCLSTEDKGDTQLFNNTTNTKYVWRPHRAVLSVLIAGGVCILVLTPIVGMLEVAYYKVRYPQKTRNLSYLGGAKKSFTSASECLGKLICIV